MKIRVDFGKKAVMRPCGNGAGISEELKPLLAAYAWKPKKSEAVLDFLSELLEGDCVCETSCLDGDLTCVAVAGNGRRLLLLANLSERSVSLSIDAGGAAVSTVRLIDNSRTDVVVPMLAAAPPLSVLLMSFKE